MSFSAWKPSSAWERTAMPKGVYEVLSDPSSTTKRFRKMSSSFSVRLRFQSWQFVSDVEREVLNLNQADKAVIREVDLLGDETRWMFARTIFPSRTLIGSGEIFHSLGTKPLGDVLFQDENFSRAEFQFAFLKPGQCEFECAIEGLNRMDFEEGLWGRRAICYFYEKPLLLTEVFFPALIQCFI